MNEWLVLAASGVAVGLLVLAIWAAGFRGAPGAVDLARLEAELGRLDPDARVRAAAFDRRGRGAAALLVDGRAFVCARMGAHLAGRIVAGRAVRVRRWRGRAVISLSDIGFPPVTIGYDGGSEPALLSDLEAAAQDRVA